MVWFDTGKDACEKVVVEHDGFVFDDDDSFFERLQQAVELAVGLVNGLDFGDEFGVLLGFFKQQAE